MPTIAVVNSKGGAGKSTVAITLAMTLAHYGKTVSLIDADQNRTLIEWSEDTVSAGLEIPKNFRLLEETRDTHIARVIQQEAQKSDFVIVDVRGAANMLLTEAITHTDFSIIPFQPKKLDAKQVSKILKVIYETEERMKKFNYQVQFTSVFTRTSHIRSKRHSELLMQLQAANAPILEVELMEQVPLERVWDGGDLWDQLEIHKNNSKEESRIRDAIENAEYFTKAILELIKEGSKEKEDA